MDRAEELARREAEAWAALGADVERLSPEQRERPELNRDGWSVKDLLWHVAYWWNDLAGSLERGSVPDDEDDDVTNARNAAALDASRGMSLAAVEEAVDSARRRMLAAWEGLAEVTDEAVERFVSETIEHYEEHLPELRRLAGEAAV